MSFWSTLLGRITQDNISQSDGYIRASIPRNPSLFAFIDVEVGLKDHKIHDIGALRYDKAIYHSPKKEGLKDFLKNTHFLCGHNIIHHDAKYLFPSKPCPQAIVDTLYISPLLFPERPYHHLIKDDKLISEQMNNPVNDCEKAKNLLMDEIAQWKQLSEEKQKIFTSLLQDKAEFGGFLEMMEAPSYPLNELAEAVHRAYEGKICLHADIDILCRTHSCELAYALALTDTTDLHSITPGWVLHNYPEVEYVIRLLRHTRCTDGCPYCNKQLDAHYNLKVFFGYERFRTYDGEPLQEKAAQAAINGKSLLAIFPTGGGKSLTFQLPALMEGRTLHGLTVVISPLQSLMKDQVDNLAARGITEAVTINGLLDPISRSLAIKRVQDGDASLLYIAPEMLRSKTIEKILMTRHVVRFVIDEAHCFSSWGQDFRVDYLYIGKFISEYQKKKKCNPIPVSCFTATAKQKVIQDISDYFKKTLNIELQLFASSASRNNLRYSVIHAETDDEKYNKLRSLISESACPTIVYVSRTKRTKMLAEQLTRDGYKALPYNGKMDSDEKIANQEAFMTDRVNIIVATSAFGMGVDKKDVGLVVHFDISDSLENYVQEAGRAGRDPELNARCYVLYCDSDLDKHFILLNQTKISISEIQQVWKAVKDLTKQRQHTCCSALEIARLAGWNDSVNDIETRVRTALSMLEKGGYIERGNNVPHVYATGITVKNIDEARRRLEQSALFNQDDLEKSVRIIKSLISQKHIQKAQNAEAESRIDYLADILGISKKEVISVVERMRQEGILADTKDISAFLQDVGITDRKSRTQLERFAQLEQYILKHIPDESLQTTRKQINENAVKDNIPTSKEKDINTLLYFLSINKYIRKKEDASQSILLTRMANMENTINRFQKRIQISRLAVEYLYKQVDVEDKNNPDKTSIQFSVIELLNYVKSELKTKDIYSNVSSIGIGDVEEALLYLSKIGALKLEGGFLVLYNAMDIRRIKDNKFRYKIDDYRIMDEFYKLKIQQIHIVGEYANLMVKDYNAALTYVNDYFHMDYKAFIAKYFKGERVKEIQRNITTKRYQQLFSTLSEKQLEIISDKESHCIVVAAGPGSGKTRVLVHKLAALLTLEDVKHEQLLMLTFSRTAATEFKQRLVELIGNAAHFVEIKTFHSYCFDLLGRIGNIEDVNNIVGQAAKMIEEGEVEPNKIGKTVLVIDEAQDMDADELALVKALIANNEEMRVIAVGDDDQCIYEFRGSNPKNMMLLTKTNGSRFIEMTQNYRSSRHVVEAANRFVKRIKERIKHTPIISISTSDGWVEVTKHTSTYMYQPVVENLMRHRNGGTSCILTQTNEEAVILVALLRKQGIRSKLIQSMDGLRFCNLAEMRYFMKCIEKNIHSPYIQNEIWEAAKQATYKKYANSESLPYIKRCLEQFETTFNTKYYTDFKEFIFESSVEDFCDISDAEVVVSTIHKSKGREFDDVYMMVTGNYERKDEQLRCFYVGITRAKQRLFIHTDCSLFDNIAIDNLYNDPQQYYMPEEVVLQLSHKDVYLDFFKRCKTAVLSLQSGDSLMYADNMFTHPKNGQPIALISKKMQSELKVWKEKGYRVTSASVRFIVAWKNKDAAKEEAETAILLPDIVLKRTLPPV